MKGLSVRQGDGGKPTREEAGTTDVRRRTENGGMPKREVEVCALAS